MLDSLERIDRSIKKLDKWLPKKKSGKGFTQQRIKQLSDRLADWAKPLLEPCRYKCLWGGRGSGKSHAVAEALLMLGCDRPIRVLCSREFQISIKESVHFLLAQKIEELGLQDFYEIQRDRIFSPVNDTEFIFKGVRHNINSIKSMAGLTHLWLEEAQSISAESWRILVPTIREPGSEIWVTFNPMHKTDVVWQEFVERDRQNAYVQRVNWDMNPWFPDVLDEERREMLRLDPDAYQHIWEGGLWEKSDAQVLNGKWIVDEFEPSDEWNGPYYGADFGFAVDPTTLNECWIWGDRLYIYRESHGVHLEQDHTAEKWKRDCPGCDRHVIRADNARPETISYLKRHGMPRIIGVDKWKGSVEDGIAHLRSYEKIVIHPRCSYTIEEARLWRYKTDPHTGDILPKLQDGNEHHWDGVRYGLSPIIQRKGGKMQQSRAYFG